MPRGPDFFVWVTFITASTVAVGGVVGLYFLITGTGYA